MRNLDLLSLRLFVQVCEDGSIARASERAHMVDSAISKRIAQLERIVGTRLLVRGRQGVQVTAAGATFLEHARGLLSAAERMADDMAAYGHGVRGQVRVLAPTTLMAESLANDVAAFLDMPDHRGIRINLQECVSADVIRGLQEGQAELGFCWDVADLGGLQSVTYRHDRLALVVWPGHPFAGLASATFAQALDHDLVGLPAGSSLQVALRRAADTAGRTLVPRVVVSTFDSALRVTQARLAIAVVAQEVAEPFARNHGLCLVPLADDWALRRFVVCCRDEHKLSAAARRLLDHLRLD